MSRQSWLAARGLFLARRPGRDAAEGAWRRHAGPERADGLPEGTDGARGLHWRPRGRHRP
eukprot:5637486-Pyramimonas_sp.AAC.2